jgi:hypothetical protein
MENNNANGQPQMIQESIWADGVVPENVDDKFKFSIRDLLMMCNDFIEKVFLAQNGFKLEGHAAEPNALPNIIMSKDGKTYAVAVVPSVFPKGALLKPEVKVAFYNKAKENGAIPLYTPVILASKDPARRQAECLLKGDLLSFLWRGFIVLDDDPNQDLKDQNLMTKEL